MFTTPGLGLGCLINSKTLFEFASFLVFLCFAFGFFAFYLLLFLLFFGLAFSSLVLVVSFYHSRGFWSLSPLFFCSCFFIYVSRVLQLVHLILLQSLNLSTKYAPSRTGTLYTSKWVQDRPPPNP